jgi:hypothetical protein
MLNSLENTCHYSDTHLIVRLKTNSPAHLHSNILKGLQVAMKMSLLVEELTKEEKDNLLALSEMLTQLMPSEAGLERYMCLNSFPLQPVQAISQAV